MSKADFPQTKMAVIGPVMGMTLVGLGIVMAVAFGVFRTFMDVDPLPVIRSIDPLWLFAALAVFVFGNLFTGHRFVCLFPWEGKEKPSRWSIGSLFFAGSVFSLLLPGPVGEVAAVAALKKRYSMDMATSLATAIHARFVGLAAAATIAAVALPMFSVPGAAGEVLEWTAVLLVLGGAGMGVLSANPNWLQAVGRRLTSTEEQTGLLGKIRSSIQHFARALTRVAHASFGTWLQVYAWSIWIQLVQVGALFCIALAMDTHADWPGLFMAQGTGSLAILVGMFLPGGLGTFELAFVASLTGAGGVSLTQAGFMLVAIRMVHLLGFACAGIFFAVWARVFLSDEVRAAVGAEDATGAP